MSVDSNSLKRIFDTLMEKITANDMQVAGSHYSSKGIQPWDYILANKLGYLEGNIVKYVSRYKEKGGLQDLHKARHYLDKLIETWTPSFKQWDEKEGTPIGNIPNS